MESQTITIQNSDDIILARMQTRLAARDIGLSIVDQARISLATSSLAEALYLGNPHVGQVSISCLDSPEKVGVQVICNTPKAPEFDALIKNLRSNEWMLMVDELTISIQPNDQLKVTIVKWNEKRPQPGAAAPGTKPSIQI